MKFLEGQGHLVETVEVGAQLKPGENLVPTPPPAPAVKVALTVADVPIELAKEVCSRAGLVAVPPNFLNPDQLAELGIDPATIGSAAPQVPAAPTAADPGASEAKQGGKKGGKKGDRLPPEQTIALIQQAATFDELNQLTADETRQDVLAAAEKRAEELKAGGAN